MSQTKKRKKDDRKSKNSLTDITENISIADIDINELIYQPKSELTNAVLGLIIKFVGKQLDKVFGAQHDSVVKVTADEVIAAMKNPANDEETRRNVIDKLLTNDGLNDEQYNELSNLCKKIDDFDSNKAGVRDDAAEEETGVIGAIVSDDDEANSDEYCSEVRDSDDEFDLDEMFEMDKKDGDKVDIEDLARKQQIIIPKIDIGEPIRREHYHEYNVPPKKGRAHSERLRSIKDLPEGMRKAFGEIKSLNYIQSRIYEKAIGTDNSLLICAPTGAGKTNIALLTMLREIMKYPKGEGYDREKFKIIYIAPIKALVQEVVENFTKRLGRDSPYKLVVKELTGDHQLNQREISEAQLIVCTPEKWDIVTRKSLDRLYTKLVKLVIFDEIHLLHNERGATLEALVARIKRHKSIEGEHIRIIGLSATLPNYKDVSRFIAPGETEENSTFYFDSTYRPIPMTQQYIALTESRKSFRMTNDIVYEKVMEKLSGGSRGQILIFVHSRPDTTKTAEFLKTRAIEEQKVGLFLSSQGSVEKINEYDNKRSEQRINPKLKELLQFGLGTHHAGMSKYERSCVEDLFRTKCINVLVSTATLAWGVNLPARTVIIKGTQVYRDGHWTDLDSLDVTQMLGRAGRPGFDKEGEGIVITQQSKVAFYISLMTEQLPVESRLIARLAEFINAECVVGNIETLDSAVSWLSETYLSSRMASVLQQDNRQYMSMYGITPEARHNDPKLVTHKHNLAYNALCILDDRGLILFDRTSGAIRSTEVGRIASNFNCSSRTMKLFYDSIHEHTSDIELFRTFSLAEEFKDIFVRRGEEADLATMINQVPFPIDDKRATPGANKVNVLLQVYIFRMNLEGSDLICDMHFIKENAARLARAIHELVLLKGYASVAELSLDLCRKIDLRMTSCHTPLRQFTDDLGADLVSRLEKKNYHIDEMRKFSRDDFIQLLRCDSHQYEKVTRMLNHLPKLEFKPKPRIKPISRNSLRVDLSISFVSRFTWNEKYHGYSERFWLFVQDVNQERLLHHEIISVKKRNALNNIKLSFVVPYLIPVHPFYYLKILPDRWFGCDCNEPLYIEKLSLPDEVSIPTQLQDCDPLPTKALDNSLFERYYESKFRGMFNQIQTQSFKYLYETDDDVILLASAGSGKTTCAELAIIHNINTRDAKSKCAYIAANAEAAQVMYDKWCRLFDEHFGVLLLTGSHRVDAANVNNKNINIVIGDPDSWHNLTLSKPKKDNRLFNKILNKFQLFIIDDIHRLSSDSNSVLEILCSKIRRSTKPNTGHQARLVALGSPMSCADSLKSWLAYERGTREPVLLNYSPSISPVKVELIIQKYHDDDYKRRLLTMQRPAYRYVAHEAGGKPAIIFVADFNRAQEVSEVLVRYSLNEGRRFASVRVDQMRDSRLRDCVEHGVGYIHLGMDQADRRQVEDLFDSERIKVLVATVGSCWSLQSRSYLTIVMDTQQHDGFEATDYDPTDIMQMMGATGRPLVDHQCRCIVMCQSSKADFYERFLRDPVAAESNLPANLATLVNYEVAVGSLEEMNNIYRDYLAHTYFYKRISINPNYYGLSVPEDPEKKVKVYGDFFNNLVNKVALDLEKHEFLTRDGSEENPRFEAGLLSQISREYYVNYETLVNYGKWLTNNLGSAELIQLISTNTVEFYHIQVRNGEIGALKYIREGRGCGREQLTSSLKVKLLMLAQQYNERLEGELVQDRDFVISTAHRLIMAIVEIAWLKDSFSLAKTSIQLAKRINPFRERPSKPELDMELTIDRATDEEGQKVKIDVTIIRKDAPFTYDEFRRTSSLPSSMYRDEVWRFLILGRSLVSKDEPDKFVLFRRVKTPQQGENHYELEFGLTDNAETYNYELYFMSDFYSTREDKKADISSAVLQK